MNKPVTHDTFIAHIKIQIKILIWQFKWVEEVQKWKITKVIYLGMLEAIREDIL